MVSHCQETPSSNLPCVNCSASAAAPTAMIVYHLKRHRCISHYYGRHLSRHRRIGRQQGTDSDVTLTDGPPPCSRRTRPRLPSHRPRCPTGPRPPCQRCALLKHGMIILICELEGRLKRVAMPEHFSSTAGVEEDMKEEKPTVVNRKPHRPPSHQTSALVNVAGES